jgi:bifunctional N-acetylglucosamine-1-phosphate-uridyltransferase/glucosamine-1-phosphate-acetyltransferase GlmU-like protein
MEIFQLGQGWIEVDPTDQKVKDQKIIFECLDSLQPTFIDNSVRVLFNCTIEHSCFFDEDVTINSNCKISHDVKIGKKSHVGNGVTIGPNTIISQSVIISDNVFIGENVIIGDNVTIGKGSRIRSGSRIGSFSIIHENVYFDKNVTLTSFCIIPPNKNIKESVSIDSIVFNGNICHDLIYCNGEFFIDRFHILDLDDFKDYFTKMMIDREDIIKNLNKQNPFTIDVQNTVIWAKEQIKKIKEII